MELSAVACDECVEDSKACGKECGSTGAGLSKLFCSSGVGSAGARFGADMPAMRSP